MKNRRQKTEDSGQIVVCRYSAHSGKMRGKAATKPLPSDGTTSHSTWLSKNDSQVAGYVIRPLMKPLAIRPGWQTTPAESLVMSSERGFSMIEMMISITIGLLILAALTGVLASNSRSAKTNDRTSELQVNGRYALDHLKRELRHAGYRGYTWAEPTSPPTTPPVLTNPAGSVPECGGAGNGFVQNIRQGIWGANDSNPFSANCIPAANYNGVNSDVLVIRRVANASTPNTLAPALVANAVYFRSAYASGEIFQGTAGPTIAGAADFAVQVSVYYIGQDDTDPNVPALRRVRLQTDTDPAAVRGSMVDEMVVRGIEHMQVQYGRTTTDLNTQYFNADAVTGTSTDTPTTLSTYAWDDVNSVRIWLLARNAKPENGYSNTNSYEMGDLTTASGTAYTVNDSFRRQMFSVVVQLRN